MAVPAVCIEQGDDATRLEALRQFGRMLPNAGLYERHPETILAALRSHMHPRENGCWSWVGEPYAIVEQKRMRLDPRLLVWVVGTATNCRHVPTLWPTCDYKECIRPEHQLEVVPLRTAVAEMQLACGEGNEQIVKAALSRGHLIRQVESPHYPKAIATTRQEWDAWLHRADLEDELLSIMPDIPLFWQPETYQRRLRTIRGEDTEQIGHLLTLCQALGWHNASRDAATRSLTAFWKRVRVMSSLAEKGCWQWQAKEEGAPLYGDGQDDPQSLVDPGQLAWVLETGALPSAIPVRFMPCTSSVDCINPHHRSEIVLVPESALLLPATMDDDACDRAVALYGRAIQEQWLRTFLWDGRLAMNLADFRFWMRAAGGPTLHTLQESGDDRRLTRGDPLLPHGPMVRGEIVSEDGVSGSVENGSAQAERADQPRAGQDVEEALHRLAYRAMHFTAVARMAEAERAVGDLLALARRQPQPIWEAQALFDTGRMYDWLTQPALAIPCFEQALHLLRRQGRARLAVSAAIALGKLLAQSGRTERAINALEEARQLVESELGGAKLLPEERAYLRLGIYRALGVAHRLGGQLDQALAWFERALQITSSWVGPSEPKALRREIVALFTESSDPDAALVIGRDFLTRRDPVEDLPLLLDVSHQLGRLCLRITDYAGAIRYFQQADRYFKRVYARPFANVVLEGRLLTDTGIAFSGQRQFARAIAYWRIGEHRLKDGGVEEQAVPRGYIEGIQQLCQERGSPFLFETLWQASETFYTWLLGHSLARLMSPDEHRRFFGTATE